MSWNIHGISSCYDDNDFLNIISEYDLIFLCETWLKENEKVYINDFEIVSSFGRPNKIGVRHEGGIAVYCKPDILNGIDVIKEIKSGIVLIKLRKEFFFKDEDIYICFVYIPHEKSSYYNVHDCDFFETIDNIVLEYKEKGNVFVCGDFNSRVGLLNDLLDFDNLDRYIGSVRHDEIPTIPKRCSMDKTVNNFGKKFIQTCYNTELTLFNGRLGNDPNGKFTFCTSNGRSVNDYLLVSPICYNLVKNFDVLGINEFSDHSPLFFEIDMKVRSQAGNNVKVHRYIKWNDEKVGQYKQKLREKQNDMTELVRNIENTDSVNHAVREITSIIYDCAFNVFGKTFVENGANVINKRIDNEWFDNDCKVARDNFHSTRNFFQRHPSDINRQIYISSRNNYNKAKRTAKFKFKRSQGHELSRLAKVNPRQFWSKVRPKRKSKCVANIDTMYEHFKNILGSEQCELSNEIKTLIDSININELHVEELDADITDTEIINAIKSLNRGKSTGCDEISGEMFIADPDFFAPILLILFNKLFEYGIYPDSWIDGIVVPVPKKGDLMDPNNYRPITLISIFSKLFTSILN